MADIVNLRRARKLKQRAEKESVAVENRARFGRPVNERKLAATLDDKRNRALDLHLRAKTEEPS